MQLFMVYLGGRVRGCHIEMHDVRFVVGESIDDTYSKLKAQWVGDKDKVHMDSYMAVNDIDGYHIAIADTPQNRPERLYFVNLGAYEADKMAEQHAFTLTVAHSAEQAKQQVKKRYLTHMSHQHKDDLHEVDDCFALDLLDNQYHIHLTPSGRSQTIKPDWFGYHVL
ncbi:DUF1543 domain-containing protein [Pseudoalteromonas ruthenica]|uniref:DUF1543 domain-containing protein n=1 Tax=Pseudoalteromonas ruthenica TaxID=151081 RepID=A0A5S3Z9Q7_9GAMM|nr:DUF1543 domain-containing protein [Pseudoalteromonas ruthenica]TMP88974.1 DUF1543 domain-containing protein [Pseudoalteromonas ruthenica]